jgi:hypothetical protein
LKKEPFVEKAPGREGAKFLGFRLEEFGSSS